MLREKIQIQGRCRSMLISMEKKLSKLFRKKQVSFNLNPTIYIIPRPTEEELQQEQEERWEMWLESLKIGP